MNSHANSKHVPRVTVLIFYFIFSAKELSDADIIAIAVSLGLTALLVVFVGYFVWRARNNPPINKNNNIAGHVSTLSSSFLQWYLFIFFTTFIKAQKNHLTHEKENLYHLTTSCSFHWQDDSVGTQLICPDYFIFLICNERALNL